MKPKSSGAADYKYWLSVRVWTAHEAAALFLGYEPDYANYSTFLVDNPDNLRAEVADKKMRLQKVLESAQKAGEFGKISRTEDGGFVCPPVTWQAWINWAQADEMPLVKALLAAVERRREKKPMVEPTALVNKKAKKISPELQKEKEVQVKELREKAKKVAIKLKKDGIHPKNITVTRICQDLLNESFSNGELFSSRWRSIEGMRKYLKGEHHPKNSAEFKGAKSTRADFNR